MPSSLYFPVILMFLQWGVQVPSNNNERRINPKDGMEMIWVPSGDLVLLNKDKSERVIAVKGFYMGIYEVTVKQFASFVEETNYKTEAEMADSIHTWKNPGFEQQDDCPVIYTSFKDALNYSRWAGLDLPGETQWRYAAKGNTTTTYSWGDEPDDPYVWHRENSLGQTHPVNSKLPNTFGIYNMVGNAYEWCKFETSDTSCLLQGVSRGGSWTRCPHVLYADMPNPPTECFPMEHALPWDDDRGFRCIYVDRARM